VIESFIDKERVLTRLPDKQEAGKNSTKNYPRKPYNGSLSTILLLIGDTDDAFLLFLWVFPAFPAF
jgi:hypothetical protein